MDFLGERTLLPEHMDRKGADGLLDYRRLKNRTSIDGLPAFDDDPLTPGHSSMSHEPTSVYSLSKTACEVPGLIGTCFTAPAQ